MILAIDPGLTTGWATLGETREFGFQSGMVKGRHAFYEWFYDLLSAQYRQRTPSQVHIIMEKFTITQATASKSPQPDPLWIIGHIEAIAHRDGFSFEFQMPAQAMAFATNDKLKAIGWYKPGKGHDNDAARHLLLAILRKPHLSERVQYQRDLICTLANKLGITLLPGLPTPEPTTAADGSPCSPWPRPGLASA